MKTVFFPLFLPLLSAFAADAPKPAPAVAPAVPIANLQALPVAVKETYFLRNLKSVGLSQQSTAAGIRQMLQFQNEQGSQNLVYEETSGTAPVKEIQLLAPFLASTVHTCSLDLECKARAFCANDCRALYYELTNVPADTSEKSNCVIRAFSCLNANPSPASGPAPASAPAATPPTAAQPAPVKGP